MLALALAAIGPVYAWAGSGLEPLTVFFVPVTR